MGNAAGGSDARDQLVESGVGHPRRAAGDQADFLEHVAAMRVWDGSEFPSGARERLAHDWAQLQSIEEQLAAVKAARARLRIDPATATGRAVQALQGVRAIGAGGAWVLATEILGGARSGMGGSSARSSGWCRRCIKAGRRSAIAGLRERAMRTCGA